MTAGKEAWWAAMASVNQFRPGGIEIEGGTTWTLEGGTSDDLRIRLTEKPRSDVPVALSETSALISLGSTSITFTPDNWDTFQSVTVTAAGNRQSIDLASSAWVSNTFYGLGITPIIAGLVPSGNRYARNVFFYDNGSLHLNFGSTESIDLDNADLTTAFENNGGISVIFGGTTYTFALAGADTTEPYTWTPSNSADVIALRNAINAASDRAATFILRDYTPGDAVISLAASGPQEYSGVTGSATVSVS